MKILIKNCDYVDEFGDIKTNKNILIEGGIIKKIGHQNNEKLFSIDGQKFLIVPGLINSHYHLGETIYVGKAPLNSLEIYLNYTIKLSKQLNLDKNHAIISRFSILNAALNGTTIFSCARGWAPTKELPLRALLNYPLMKSQKLLNYYEDFSQKFDFLIKEYPKKYINGTNKICFGLWIHSINYIDKKILKIVSKKFKNNNDIRLTIHLSETRNGAEEIKKKWGKTEIQILDDYDLLNERTNLVHVIYLDENDENLIAKNNSNITICPTSNMLLRSGLPNIKSFLKKGINVSIGTDGLATTTSASLLEATKIFYLLFRNLNISLKTLLKMITINPAITLGFKKMGSIKEGNCADLLFYCKDNIALHPLDSILHNLLLGETIRPKKIMVNGKFIMRNLISKKKGIVQEFENLRSEIYDG